MEIKNAEDYSLIQSGSGLNYMSFKDEGSWDSLHQSTILAGHISISESDDDSQESDYISIKIEKPTQLAEKTSEETSTIEMKTENVLNLNLYALSDEEVFFDCDDSLERSSLSSSASEDVQVASTNLPSIQLPTSYHDSCEDIEKNKTGGMLVNMIEQMNGQKDHALLVPKLEASRRSRAVTPKCWYSPNLEKRRLRVSHIKDRFEKVISNQTSNESMTAKKAKVPSASFATGNSSTFQKSLKVPGKTSNRSSIMNRKSMGGVQGTVIKSVQELRKTFSPGVKNVKQRNGSLTKERQNSPRDKMVARRKPCS